MSENLKQKANEILDATVKEKTKYKNERKLLFFLLEHIHEENDESLQQMLDIFSRVIKLEGESESYRNIKCIFNEIVEQHTRKEDGKNKERITLFKIKDKNNEEYTFFTRNNAKTYMENNPEKFENVKIEVIKNNNIDLENLISSI